MSGFSGKLIVVALVAALAVCLWAQTGVTLAQTATEKAVKQETAPAKVETGAVKEAKPVAVSPKPVISPATEVEIQRRFNELKSEVLGARAAYIDRWLAATAIFLTLLGILGIIGGYIGLSKFWEIEADARRSVEEINERNEETR